MANSGMNTLILPISHREFDLYALSLERGPNFKPMEFVSAYKLGCGSACGCILFDPRRNTFSSVTLRRRVDCRWVLVNEAGGFSSPEAALDCIGVNMRNGQPAEPLPPGARRRQLLLKTASRGTSPEFDLLTGTISHLPALTAIKECYLALPNPDSNFVSDFQTNNFASRLFELYLLACFREQGMAVYQEHVSPDFYIELDGASCWIEAVTANSSVPRSGGIGPWVHAPKDRNDRLAGTVAERFAKTLRGKIQRKYHELPHVRGQSFAIAIADFHASGSMVWSREALPTYLYGVRVDIKGEGAHRCAIGTPITRLEGKDQIPAGLFYDPEFSYLSAIIFSNAATLAKFNRMGFLAGCQPPGLTMIRQGILFDRTPGAVDPIDFKFSILSPEYGALWSSGEAWCQELEIFHNPLAVKPVPFDLIPGATHWFEQDGEIICNTIWENSVLSSITELYSTDEAVEML